MITIIVVYWE